MAIRRVLIWLQTTSPAGNGQIIATAAKLARDHGGELNAIITTPELSRSGHWALGAMVSSMAADIEARAERAAADLGATLDQARAAAGLGGVTTVQALAPHLFGEAVAQKGRTADLVITGLSADPDARGQVEAVLFGVARPVLVLPHAADKPDDHAFSLDKIALAWDGSRTATRALYDALPLLRRAASVTLIQIRDDKDLSKAGSLADAMALLARHDVQSGVLEVSGGGKPTAAAMQDAFAQSGADVLVMGAYGHSRAREFILGGATRGILQAPFAPLVLSH